MTTKNIVISILVFALGLITGLVISGNRSVNLDYNELENIMLKSAMKIQLSSPAVNMTVQKLDFEQMKRMRISGDFIWSPTFQADNLILEGHRGIPYDSTSSTRSLGSNQESNAVTILPIQ